MNEFLYNFAWWFYTMVTAFMLGVAWGAFLAVIDFQGKYAYLSFEFRAVSFVVIFFIALILLSARTPLLNWIGGEL